MKAIAMILLFAATSVGCASAVSNEIKKSVIEYQALSRGYFLNISIQNEKFSVVDKRSGEAKVLNLTDKDWKELSELYQYIKIEKLSTYKGPTQKRFYDGAAIASLRITYDGKIYESEGFDHGSPPKEIEAFVNKLVLISNTGTKNEN